MTVNNQHRHDVSLIGEAVSEGGNGCFTASYDDADHGILVVAVGDGKRFYKLTVTPTDDPRQYEEEHDCQCHHCKGDVCNHEKCRGFWVEPIFLNQMECECRCHL